MDLHAPRYNNHIGKRKLYDAKNMNIRTKISIVVGIIVLGYGAVLFRSSAPGVPISGDPTPVAQSNTTPYPADNAVTPKNNNSAPQSQKRADSPQPAVATIASDTSVAKTVINGTEYPLRVYRPVGMPNDPLASQWGFTQARLPAAWDTPRGNNSTVLAIIDTGFALAHEEFASRWYSNPGETGSASSEAVSLRNCTDRSLAISANCNLVDDDHDGIVDNETGSATYQNPSQLNCTDRSSSLMKSCNRIDDDANGYIDDVSGWDFIDGDRSPQAGELNPTGTGTTHGTKVAGIAAATGNNSVGIAGSDWGTTILPIQALNDDGYGDTRSVGNAINYAVARGANVISLSLGTSLPDSYVEQAVRAATAAGITVVAAAGNDGCDCMVYPANYPETVAVGALDASSQRASFSSYGRNLDILAPGVNMTSSSWSAGNQSNTYASGLNGTSFATPLVSGVMTRLLSQQPRATPLQLTAAITENAQPLSLTTATPRSDTIGFGTLDAGKSTARMATPYAPARVYAFSNVSSGGYLDMAHPAEIPGTYTPYQCPADIKGSTALYKMTKNKDMFYTISPSEMHSAENQGYVGALLAYGCLLQPHDTPAAIRKLNTKREF